jgi:excisionase family DNA binding protein
MALKASRTSARASSKKTKFGGSIIGDIDWGSHICQLYHSKQDLIDVLVPYFKTGLENNELCMWVTSKPLKAHEATAALHGAMKDLDRRIAKNQIEIMEMENWYTRTGEFGTGGMIHSWLEKEKLAISKGFVGLRVCAHTFHLPPSKWQNIVDYESAMDSIIKRHNVIAVCSYAIHQCGVPELVDIVSNHRFIILRRQEKWELTENTGYSWVNELRRNGMSYAQIGDKLGLSRERIRQIVTRRDVSQRILPDNQMLTVSEASRLLHVHANTLRRWDEDGTMPSCRIGPRGDRRYRLSDLLDFAQKKTSQGMS